MFPDDMFFIFLSIEGWARELETIMNELGNGQTAGSLHDYKRLKLNNNTRIVMSHSDII
jgi:hypothetical protein